MECPVCDEFVVPNPQFHLRRRSGARGDRDASYLVRRARVIGRLSTPSSL